MPLRVTRTDGRQVVLDSARVVGDSLVGRARPDPSRPARPRGAAPASPADDPPLNGARVAVALAAVAGTEAWQPVAGPRPSGPECRAGRADQPPCRDADFSALMLIALLLAPLVLLLR